MIAHNRLAGREIAQAGWGDPIGRNYDPNDSHVVVVDLETDCPTGAVTVQIPYLLR